jgi:hypothetical protein
VKVYLINGLIADESFADEQNEVRVVDGDQLGQGAHQRTVVLEK